jgi:hypothetical protein
MADLPGYQQVFWITHRTGGQGSSITDGGYLLMGQGKNLALSGQP